MKFLQLAPFGLVVSLSLIAGAASSATAADDEPPKRRPGLWRITTISPDIGMRINEVCIEAGDSIIGALDGNCAKPSVAHAKDQTIVSIECGSKDSREITSLLFTGDFQSWYRAQARMSAKGAHKGFTIDAKFLSERCMR
jgi:hypothetical protein